MAVKSREHIYVPPDIGAKISDGVAQTIGSWPFIITQSVILAIWLILNCVGWFFHWDTYPFILLNLMLSFQAAYSAPIIMMSQNRQADKDRSRDNHEAEEVDMLYRINEQQLEILNALREAHIEEVVKQYTHERFTKLENISLSQMDRLQHLIEQVDRMASVKPLRMKKD